MMRRLVILMTLLLLLTGAMLTQAQVAIDGLNDADLALLVSASEGMDSDSLHFDMDLSVGVDGDPAVDFQIALAGTAAFGADDADEPIMTMELAGTTTTGVADPVPLNVSLRLVDGVLYLRLGDGQIWQGMSFDENLSATGLDLDVTQLAGAQALDFLGWMQTGGLDAFSSGERLADADGLANLNIEVDLSAWLLSPTFANLLQLAGAATGDDSLAALGPLLGVLLDDLLLTLEPAIEIDGGLMRQLGLELGMSLNSSMLGGGQALPAVISVTLALDDMRYNQSLEVSAPEGEVAFSE